MIPTIILLFATFHTYRTKCFTTLIKEKSYRARWSILNQNAQYCNWYLCCFVYYLLERLKRRHEKNVYKYQWNQLNEHNTNLYIEHLLCFVTIPST